MYEVMSRAPPDESRAPCVCGCLRFVDLAPLMSPQHLAEQAVDLNLRLMRWRAAPSLELNKVAAAKCLLLGGWAAAGGWAGPCQVLWWLGLAARWVGSCWWVGWVMLGVLVVGPCC